MELLAPESTLRQGSLLSHADVEAGLMQLSEDGSVFHVGAFVPPPASPPAPAQDSSTLSELFTPVSALSIALGLCAWWRRATPRRAKGYEKVALTQGDGDGDFDAATEVVFDDSSLHRVGTFEGSKEQAGKTQGVAPPAAPADSFELLPARPSRSVAPIPLVPDAADPLPSPSITDIATAPVDWSSADMSPTKIAPSPLPAETIHDDFEDANSDPKPFPPRHLAMDGGDGGISAQGGELGAVACCMDACADPYQVGRRSTTARPMV